MEQIVSEERLADGDLINYLPTEGAHQQIWKLRRVFPRRPGGCNPWEKLWKLIQEPTTNHIVVKVVSILDATPPAWPRFVISGLGVPRIKKAVEETSKDKLRQILGDFTYSTTKIPHLVITWWFLEG